MINAILIDHERDSLVLLEKKLQNFCPFVNIKGTTNCPKKGYRMIAEKQADLVFLEAELFENSGVDPSYILNPSDFESIFVARLSSYALNAFKYRAIGFILKPIQEEELIITLKFVEQRIKEKQKSKNREKLLRTMFQESSSHKVIGIPTMEGFEFVAIHDIIRCEGLQKCTRIFTQQRSDIVSSYNLGEFIKLLEPYSFFSTHRSHLINLTKIVRYHKEGSIILSDGSYVPVSRRKKCEFLDRITHL